MYICINKVFPTSVDDCLYFASRFLKTSVNTWVIRQVIIDVIISTTEHIQMHRFLTSWQLTVLETSWAPWQQRMKPARFSRIQTTDSNTNRLTCVRETRGNEVMVQSKSNTSQSYYSSMHTVPCRICENVNNFNKIREIWWNLYLTYIILALKSGIRKWHVYYCLKFAFDLLMFLKKSLMFTKTAFIWSKIQ